MDIIDYALTGCTVSFGQKLWKWVFLLLSGRMIDGMCVVFAHFVGCINSVEWILGFLSSRCWSRYFILHSFFSVSLLFPCVQCTGSGGCFPRRVMLAICYQSLGMFCRCCFAKFFSLNFNDVVIVLFKLFLNGSSSKILFGHSRLMLLVWLLIDSILRLLMQRRL